MTKTVSALEDVLKPWIWDGTMRFCKLCLNDEPDGHKPWCTIPTRCAEDKLKRITEEVLREVADTFAPNCRPSTPRLRAKVEALLAQDPRKALEEIGAWS